MVKVEWHKDPWIVLDYYTGRLEQMTAYAQALGQKVLFLRSEQIIEQTATTFQAIQHF